MCYQFDARSKASQHFQRHSNCSLFTLTFKLNLDFFFQFPSYARKKKIFSPQLELNVLFQ